jgi:hypothetical protein
MLNDDILVEKIRGGEGVVICKIQFFGGFRIVLLRFLTNTREIMAFLLKHRDLNPIEYNPQNNHEDLYSSDGIKAITAETPQRCPNFEGIINKELATVFRTIMLSR